MVKIWDLKYYFFVGWLVGFFILSFSLIAFCSILLMHYLIALYYTFLECCIIIL